ncbi:hypothetical protein JCM11641_005395 [Rhodosporidiobolus odoratus]
MRFRKPVSGKARKQQLQVQRATKKADWVPTLFPADEHAATSSAPSPSTSTSLGSPAHADRIGQRWRTPQQRERETLRAGRMALESRFIRLPKSDRPAAADPLLRPIPSELGILDDPKSTIDHELTCPKRPKWHYHQTKKEVERNEDGMFKKWLAGTNETLSTSDAASPTFFELNTSVWKQLWRTVERSDILLLLIDVRFPLLHYPPSLRSYLRTLKSPKVLVLTKTDLVPSKYAEGWKQWLEKLEGPEGAQVVLMESYREAETREETQGTQSRSVPAAPPSARRNLVAALRTAHAALLAPPSVVAADPHKLSRWSPRVRPEVEWDLVEAEGGETGAHAGLGQEEAGKKGVGKAAKGKRRKHEMGEVEGPGDFPVGDVTTVPGDVGTSSEREVPPYLSVGLIGQPNVGKSSLLNALLGKKVVRASKTPGKTKTLQTIFWNRHLRLVDCPGLVCPSSVGFERQVLGAIIPIQNIEPVLQFISKRLPLEEVLRLRHPDAQQDEEEDEFSFEQPKEVCEWTTDDILVAYAVQQNFVTAKVGRPDIYRAGSHILRLIHASVIPWAFRPPDSSVDIASDIEPKGIWLHGFKPMTAPSLTKGEDQDESEQGGAEEESEDDSEGEGEDSADDHAVQAVRGAFAALAVEGEETESDDQSDSSGGDGEGSAVSESE